MGLEETVLHGFVDECGCDRVRGWAWDARHPDRTIEVEVRLSGELLAIARADRFRSDLVLPGARSGKQAFDLVLTHPVPAERVPDLTVTIRDTDFALPFSQPSASAQAAESADRTRVVQQPARWPQRFVRRLPIVRTRLNRILERPRWISLCGATESLHAEIITALLPPDVGELSLLDLGCGLAPATRGISCARRTFVDLARPRGAPDPFVEADAVEFLRERRHGADLVFALDMIEHLHRARGQELLQLVTGSATRLAVFFTPLGPMLVNPRDPTGHKAGWWPEEFEARGYRTWVFPRFHAPWLDGFVWGEFYAWRWMRAEPIAEKRVRRLAARLGVTDAEADLLDESLSQGLSIAQRDHWHGLRTTYLHRLFPSPTAREVS